MSFKRFLFRDGLAKFFEIANFVPDNAPDISELSDLLDMQDIEDSIEDTHDGNTNNAHNFETTKYEPKKFTTMAANSGTIVDTLEHAKEKYPNDLDMQGKYLLAFVSLIKRDNGDVVQTIQAPYQHYNAILSAFPSGGMVWCVWELYSGASREGIGLERLNPNTDEVSLLFSSNPSITRPIIPNLMV